MMIQFDIILKRYKLNRDKYSGEEKYSRGWRGAPAKGVGRVTGARVQIPPSPFNNKNLKKFKKVVDKQESLW